MKIIFKTIICLSFVFMIGCSEASSVEEKVVMGMVQADIEDGSIEIGTEEIRMNRDFTCDYSKIIITDMGNNRYNFIAELDVPSRGYKYSLTSKGQDVKNVWNIDLKLISPTRAAGMAISKVKIDEVLELDAEVLDRVNINIQKSFKWGPDKATCVIPYE